MIIKTKINVIPQVQLSFVPDIYTHILFIIVNALMTLFFELVYSSCADHKMVFRAFILILLWFALNGFCSDVINIGKEIVIENQ